MLAFFMTWINLFVGIIFAHLEVPAGVIVCMGFGMYWSYQLWFKELKKHLDD